MFVVISGTPGSGKSTLAVDLAPALGLPLFMKDTIKEALGDVLDHASLDASMLLGAATMRVLLALARDNAGAVIESTWMPELAREELQRLTPLIEVFCEVPIHVAIERFTHRSPTRHAVHAEHLRTLDRAAMQERARPVDGGWPVIRVDTTKPVDIKALADEVRDASA